MRLTILHSSRYDYSNPIAHGLLRIRLKPKSTHGQVILDWAMDLDGAGVETEYEDQHNNAVMLASLAPGSSAVTVTCRGTVETADNAGAIGQHAGHMPLWIFTKPTDLTRAGPRIRKLSSALEIGPAALLGSLHELSARVLDAVRYEIGRTDAQTRAEEALQVGHGVCQDHAHIFIAAARELGIPARYVSGYLMMDDRSEQEAGHAWAEAHVPDLGWVGFDVSNGICPDERYVRVATGCDYRDAAPIAGISFGAGDSTLKVRLSVEQHTAAQ
ncbi:MAG: transglutaminase family protein [Erythrobacter sp.]